jgi:hypothetical protein
MKTFVRRIGLISKTGEVRKVDLGPGLNIVTGDSKTGKSALIEIVDYCLFASRSTIPVGVINDFADFYSITLEGSESRITIVRPSGKSGEGNQAAFIVSQISAEIEPLSISMAVNMEYQTLKETQRDVERLLGLNVLDTRSNEDDDRRNAGKATLRSAASLLFQHQNLIANKHSVFYRFDDLFERKKTIDQFPILLGWVDGEYYAVKQRLESLRARRTTLLKEIEKQNERRQDRVLRLREPLQTYFRAIGQRLEENLDYVALKSIAQNLPTPSYQAESESNIDKQIRELEEKIEQLRVELRRVESTIADSQRGVESIETYRDSLALLMGKVELAKPIDKVVCPLCSQTVASISPNIAALERSRSQIVREYRGLNNYGRDVSPYLRNLFLERDTVKREIRQLSISRMSLVELDSKEKQVHENLRESLA